MDSKLINEIRFFHFISGILAEQQNDPLCGKCKAFANTAERMKEGLAVLEDLPACNAEALKAEVCSLLQSARIRLDGLKIPEGAVGQKKAGRCSMPEGVCFIKLSKSVRDRI